MENDTEYNNTKRLFTSLNRINDSNIVNYYNGKSLMDSKNSQEIGYYEDYSKNKLNDIKNDLLLIKNQIKQELKDEVKNELKEEIKNEFKKPSTIKIEDDINKPKIYQRKMSKDCIRQNDRNIIKLIDNEIYCKKNNSNFFIKNKFKNRCCSQEKFMDINNNKIKYNDNNNEIERKSYNTFYLKNNNEKNIIKKNYKERYEKLNDLTNNIENKGTYNSKYLDFYKNSIITYDFKNKSFFKEGPKKANKQEIKKLIRLYNIAKDTERNHYKYNDEIPYNIINNNKSISNIVFLNNENNKEDKINNNKIIDAKNQNESKNENTEVRNENNLINEYNFPRKYENVKPIGNFHKFIYNKSLLNNDEINLQNLNEEKNLINENNKIMKNQNIEIYEEKAKIKNINKTNEINGRINIKPYKDENIIYMDDKKERKSQIILSNSDNLDKKENIEAIKNKTGKSDIEKETIIKHKNIIKNNKILNDNNEYNNNIKNENINDKKEIKENNYNDSKINCEKRKNEKYKTPNQIKKEYDYDNRYNSNNMSNNIASRTTPYTKQKKYIPYKYLSSKAKINENKNNQTNNIWNRNI